ncbi:MAG TPA: hypothetical protein VIX58_01465 [Anaerolineae bacterium]
MSNREQGGWAEFQALRETLSRRSVNGIVRFQFAPVMQITEKDGG